jgi:hypothetical protein
MGQHSANNSIMSRACAALVIWLSSALEEAEREAVLGDLAEIAEPGSKAICGVLALVLRRRAVVLRDWRLWLVFATVLIPLSFSLCMLSQDVAHESAVYTWMYANNWDWGLVKNFGFWYVFGDVVSRVFANSLTLACWSWSTGFVLGSLRSKIMRVSQVLLLLLLVISQSISAPQRFTLLLMKLYGPPDLPALPDPNGPVTAMTFYHLLFPWLVLAIVVVLPAMLGVRHGKQVFILTPAFRIALLIAAVMVILTMMPQVRGFGLLLGASGRQWLWHHKDAMQMLSLITYWPTFYLAVVGFKRYRRQKFAVSQ